MRPKIDAEFLMCFLQTDSFVKVVLDSCTGTSYPAINSNDLSNLEIDLPTSEDEQRRIGCFITNLDHLITLHQRQFIFCIISYVVKQSITQFTITHLANYALCIIMTFLYKIFSYMYNLILYIYATCQWYYLPTTGMLSLTKH